MRMKKWKYLLSNLANVSILIALSTGLLSYSSAAAMSAAACSAAITVSNANDDGTGSLRQALVDVCAGGTISFDASVFNSTSPQTILLASEITIDKSLTLDGPGAGVLAISGGSKIRPFTINSGITVVIQDVTIKQGHANSGSGIYNNGTLTVKYSTFTTNYSATNGGGIYNNGTLTVQYSTLSENSASITSTGAGGGIFNNASGIATVQNSTFSGNTLDAGNGGGIFNSGTLSIQNSTLSGNNAGSVFSGTGGGIYNSGTLNFSNTIIANSYYGDCYNNGTIATNSHNLVKDNTCSPTISGDPLLGTLGNYGGSTQTMKPGSGSPVIGAGSGCLETDQRGVTRGTACDIGAFETSGVMVSTVVATSISGTGTTLNGTINANDSDNLTITFNYGTTTSYGTTVAATPSTVSGMGDVAISKTLTGLNPNTTYHFRVVGTGTGTTNGSDATFTTSAVVPTVTTDAASSITGSGATLNGTVNANNASTTVTFQYGLTSTLRRK
ncbi:MAG: choice-of-anchor Q domain-containing protein [Chloroflexota bacterium]